MADSTKAIPRLCLRLPRRPDEIGTPRNDSSLNIQIGVLGVRLDKSLAGCDITSFVPLSKRKISGF